MSFRDNLQHLRATRGMTQEQLAVLLGVSRQSVTKWEAERAYPEMDKLLKICSIFDCTLDELVQGDLTQRPSRPEAVAACACLPEDTCGYDAHMRSRAWHIALGVVLIILGVALGSFMDGLLPRDSGVATVACIFMGIVGGLALIIPSAMEHGAFVRAHPFVEDFYSADDKQRATRALAYSVVGGIGLIFAGILTACILDGAAVRENTVGGLMLALVALGVGCLVYGGLMHGRVNVEAYNNEEVAEELSEADIDAIGDPARRRRLLAQKRRSKTTGAVCGIIMLCATIVGLTLLFVPGLHTAYFWLAWPLGGLGCGIASIAINGFSRD